ncbi:MAG: GNAT family N-acetyltransferase [Bacteroidales bacterium]|nr:GNAT family N-acetyltransferase [Bacteroidales bacterium]
MNHKQQARLFTILSILYALASTAVFLLPASFLRYDLPTGSDKIIHFLIYLMMAWLVAGIPGQCPLRWRRLIPWMFVIVFTHAYYIEFLQAHWTGLGRRFEWGDLMADMLGIALGIFIRYRGAFRQCRCGLNVSPAHPSKNKTELPVRGPMTICSNPVLPGIIARSFGWKSVRVRLGKDLEADMVCTGKSIVSLPHFSYAAVYSTESLSQQAWQKTVQDLAAPRNIAEAEIRLPQEASLPEQPKTASWLHLEKSYDLTFKHFSSNLRRKIRKASKNEFKVWQGGIELLPDFWKVYVHHMNDLGSAALPMYWFRHLLNEYAGGYAGIFLVAKYGKVVGAAFNLEYQGFYENCWFVTDMKAQKEYASYLLHDRMIHHAILLEAKTYSFGRSSTGGGVHQFKKQWGTTDIPLAWIKYPEAGPGIRKQKWLLFIWKRVPTRLRNFPGRYLAKWIY